MAPLRIKVVFFDLGDTLVHKPSGSPPGARFDWVPGAREVLTALGERGIRLGLISNTGSLMRADLSALLPTNFQFGRFDGGLVVLSSEVGIEKPDVRIFERALEQTRQRHAGGLGPRADPAECLFCGESAIEVLVAQTAGMRGYRVTTHGARDTGRVVDTLIQVGLLPAPA